MVTTSVEVKLFKPDGESLGYSVAVEPGEGVIVSAKLGGVKTVAATEELSSQPDGGSGSGLGGGLELYDLIVAINGESVVEVTTMKEVKAILDRHRPELALTVMRSGRTST